MRGFRRRAILVAGAAGVAAIIQPADAKAQPADPADAMSGTRLGYAISDSPGAGRKAV